MSEPDALDPRWRWVEIPGLCGRAPRYVRGACNHLELEPVIDPDGVRVATLCVTCDTQLPARYDQTDGDP